MNKRNIISIITLFVLMAIALPALAQGTIDPSPTAEVMTPAIPPPDTSITGIPQAIIIWLPATAMIVLTLGLLGAFVLIYKVADRAGVNVSPEALQAIGATLVTSINQQLDTMQQQADRTETPIDDLALALVDAPIERLIATLKQRGYTVEHHEPEPTT